MKKHTFIDKTIAGQKIRVLENQIHIAIANYLNLVIKRPSRWTTIEVSNQAQGRAAMIRQMQLKRKGVTTGFPDIMIIERDTDSCGNWITSLIFLEVKVPSGKLTEKQEVLHQELREDGHHVSVVYSVNDVEIILKELGVI
jgi:hypothetical protein